jgi:hypothetical protein
MYEWLFSSARFAPLATDRPAWLACGVLTSHASLRVSSWIDSAEPEASDRSRDRICLAKIAYPCPLGRSCACLPRSLSPISSPRRTSWPKARCCEIASDESMVPPHPAATGGEMHQTHEWGWRPGRRLARLMRHHAGRWLSWSRDRTCRQFIAFGRRAK